MLLAQLVVLVSHLALAALNVDLFALDLPNQSLPNVLFQCQSLLVSNAHRIFYFGFFLLGLHFNQPVSSSTLLVLLLKLLHKYTQLLLGDSFFVLMGVVLLRTTCNYQLSVLPKSSYLLVVRLFKSKQSVFLLLESALLIANLFLFNLQLHLLVLQ